MANYVDVGADDEHAAPVTPVSYLLSFTDLCYSVREERGGVPMSSCLPSRRSNRLTPTDSQPTNANTKVLLSGISGEAREGELFAVMGASGSGKSMLLDGLAGRIIRGSLRGTVTLNGEPLDGRRLSAISAYVMQEGLLHPMLTVRETLLFAAKLRLSRTLSPARKRDRVDTLIDQLGLSGAAYTVIGGETHRVVSGGERRRVSIGTDIIHDPILLFLDEPMVVEVLRTIARSGSVVVMTIHQPNACILGRLGHLLLLSRGRTVYAGIKPFFSEFVGTPVPENENPARRLHAARRLQCQVAARRHKSQDKQHVDPARVGRPRERLPWEAGGWERHGDAVADVREDANSLTTEVWVLTKRSFTNTRRMPELFGMRLTMMMVTGLVLATIFLRLDDTPKGVQEWLGFLAMSMAIVFFVCADALPVFIQERHIYLRETAHNAYRTISYVLANALVSFPPLDVLSLAFVVTTCFAVGLAGGGASFAFFSLVVLASMWAATGFALLISAAVPHVMLAYTVVSAFLTYFLLFSGFFINQDRIPSFWIWFHYVSLIKYAYQAALQNEFSDATRCFTRGIQVFDETPIGGMLEAVKMKVLGAISTALGNNITASTCIVTGADVLSKQDATDVGKWTCLLVTSLSGFFFRELFYVILLVGSKNKRR